MPHNCPTTELELVSTECTSYYQCPHCGRHFDAKAIKRIMEGEQVDETQG